MQHLYPQVDLNWESSSSMGRMLTIGFNWVLLHDATEVHMSLIMLHVVAS